MVPIIIGVEGVRLLLSLLMDAVSSSFCWLCVKVIVDLGSLFGDVDISSSNKFC